MMYVHIRNLYYQNHGIDVTELNFRAKESYEFQGIRVVTLDDYRHAPQTYDLLILHAANIKHHYRFLLKYGDRFPVFLFFYHGHEVIKRSAAYPDPYPFVKMNYVKRVFRDVYDDFKLSVWRRYLPKVIDKSWLVFVSRLMMHDFFQWTAIPEKVIGDRYQITYNCVGKKFETAQYDLQAEKKYDFVTIRNNLDGSAYSIDLVNRIARNTPSAKFLVVGKGKFFSVYEKAENIEWWDMTMTHDEIVRTLNMSRFALMPTRRDTQGVMACEMAAYGIPLITSDIPVCHEIFDECRNVWFIDNKRDSDLTEFLRLNPAPAKDDRYYEERTVSKEVALITALCEKQDG